MDITQIAAILATIGFAGMMFFQLALAAGFPLGRMAWGGEHEILPARLRGGSVISAGIFVFASIAVLERAQLVEIIGNPTFVRYTVWFLSAFFTLGIVMNLISRSPIERKVMTPVAAILTALCYIVAFTAP